MFDFVVASLERGGWVLLPIYLASLWGWMLVANIAFRLWDLYMPARRRKLLQRAPQEVRPWLQSRSGSWHRRSLVHRMVSRLDKAPAHASKEFLEELHEEVMRHGHPELERGLSTLSVIAGVAPLLGLLGTVTGMVTTFRVIGAFGTSNPALMADSIAEALMTTQNGLVVAFPLMLVHVFLLNLSSGIEQDAEEAGAAYIEYLQSKESGSVAA